MNIITINYHLSVDKIVNTQLDGDETLLDADLVIIDPSSFSSMWKSHIASRTGGPTVYSPNSDRLKNIFSSRRGEIETLLECGKIIVVFASPVNGFNAEINDQNRYEIVTNYDLLPIRQDFILKNLTQGKSTGDNAITLVNSNSLFAQYFKTFKDELEYSAYLNLDAKDNPDFFLLNRSNKPVGFNIPNRNGIIIFLPPPIYQPDNQKLVGTLVGCAKKFLTKHEKTPPPNWVEEYKIAGENEFDAKIQKLREQLDEINNQKQKFEEQKGELTKFKALLFEQGPELEKIVIESFKLFGFKAENRKLDDLEHDIVFESN